MVLIMITRGRLAIGNVVTFVERLMLTFSERIVRRHMDVS